MRIPLEGRQFSSPASWIVNPEQSEGCGIGQLTAAQARELTCSSEYSNIGL